MIGAQLKIIVRWGKLRDKVEVLDTGDLGDLRDAIKAKFSPLFNSYAASQLGVRTKDSTGKLLDFTAMIADQLGKDGEVWVEVPEEATGQYYLQNIFFQIRCTLYVS